MTNRRDLLAGMFSALGTGAMANPVVVSPYGLTPRGTNAIVTEQAPIGRFGFVLIDIESGKIMDSANEDDLFIPASLSKIPTSYAAMKVHGPAARFATKLRANGPINNGILEGDLHMIGGGDPSLDTNDLMGLANQLLSAGIYQITGRFIYYGAALPQSEWLDKTQPWQAPYNPSMGGLNLNYNRVQFSWSREGGYLRVRGAAVSDGKVSPTPSVQFRVTQDGPALQHEDLGQTELWNIGQSALTGKGKRWLPIRKPGAFAAGVFQTICAEMGIFLPTPESATGAPAGSEIATHRSGSVYEMLRGMLKYSNNLTAEALGASAGYASGSKPRNIRHAASLTTQMTVKEVGGVGGNGWNGFSLENHSGLSVLSRATPRQLAYTLRAGQKKWGDEYLALFNNKTMTPQRMNLPAGVVPPRHFILGKTGSMHFVRGLAGYAQINDRLTAYAFMASEDSSRDILNASFTPYGDPSPSAARNWARRTKEFERAMLKEWILRYSV